MKDDKAVERGIYLEVVLTIAVILLTFLLTLINKPLKLLRRYEANFIKVLVENSAYLWFLIVILIGFTNRGSFGITLPREWLHFSTKEFLYIILGLGLFGLFSGYRPGKRIKEILTFCLIFPVGEEVLFRGIIQSISNFIIGDNLIFVPMPLFKVVTLHVLISALCFSITHFQYFDFKIDSSIIRKALFAFIFGLFAGNIVEMTGSICLV